MKRIALVISACLVATVFASVPADANEASIPTEDVQTADIEASSLPNVQVNDIEVLEPNVGAIRIRLYFTLSAPAVPIDEWGWGSIRIKAVDGTATRADRDYRPLNRRVRWGPGVTSSFVDIRIPGDSKFEEDEYFFIELSQPNKVNIPAGTRMKITLKNNDIERIAPKVRVSSYPTVVTETDRGWQNVAVTFTLNQPTPRNASFRFTTTGDGARPGSDFGLIRNRRVVVRANQSSATVRIRIRGDRKSEGTEAIDFRIHDLVDLQLDTSSPNLDSGRITIIDND